MFITVLCIIIKTGKSLNIQQHGADQVNHGSAYNGILYGHSTEFKQYIIKLRMARKSTHYILLREEKQVIKL